MKGVTKIFQLEKGRNDGSGLRFAVNRVFDATSPSPAEPKTHMLQNSSTGSDEGSSSKTSTAKGTRRKLVLIHVGEDDNEDSELRKKKALEDEVLNKTDDLNN